MERLQKYWKLGASLVLVAFLGVAMAACGGSDDTSNESSNGDFDGQIKMGANIELSGPGNFYGLSRSFGIQAGVKDVNDNGGIEIDGKNYELVAEICDNRTDPTYGLQCAQEDVDNEVLWTVAPDAGFEGAYQLYQDNDIVTLGNGGVATDLLREEPEKHPMLFFESLSYDGLVESHFAKVRALYPDLKTAGGLFPDDANGQTYANASERYAKEYGFNWVGAEFHPPEASGDFSTYLTTLKNKGTDTIWLGYYPQVVAAALEQGSDLDAAKVFMSEGIMPADLEGVNFDGYPLLSDFSAFAYTDNFQPDDEDSQRVIKNIAEAAEGKPFVSSISVLGYVNEVMVMKEALEQANSTDPADLAEALLDVEYKGPFGPATSLPESHSFKLKQSAFLYGDGKDGTMKAFVFESPFSEEPLSETVVPLK